MPICGARRKATMLTETKIRGIEDAAAAVQSRATTLLIATGTAALWFLNTRAFRYFTISQDTYGIYWGRRQWVLAHVVAGTAALMLGPIQLWLGLNRRTTVLHRVSGAAYVAGVAVGSVAAVQLALKTDFGWVFGTGLFSMALAWFMTTALATIAVWRKLIVQHREWMIRSYVVTFGFVTFRIVAGILAAAHVGTMPDQLTAASWLCWSVPLLITEAILQGRKILARPMSGANASPPGRSHQELSRSHR